MEKILNAEVHTTQELNLLVLTGKTNAEPLIIHFYIFVTSYYKYAVFMSCVSQSFFSMYFFKL